MTSPLTFKAFGKVIEARAAVIPEIELGPIRGISLPVQVKDLSGLNAIWAFLSPAFLDWTCFSVIQFPP